METLVIIAKLLGTIALVVFATGSLSLLFFSFSDDLGKYKGWKAFSFALMLVFIQLFVYIEVSSEQRKEESTQTANALTKWQAAGCPVYKSQCGSKHPYACEKKASVIGRNQVGDTFVQAYGLCVK
jgi:hypothetical protein